MTDEMNEPGEFRASASAADEGVRQRIAVHATQESGSPNAARRTSLRQTMQSRVVLVGLFVLVAAGISAVMAMRGGAAQTPSQVAATALSQVQNQFGDNLVSSSSVQASTLNVSVAPTDGPSLIRAVFEARILAHSVADSMTSAGQTPVTTVQYLDPNGVPLPSYSAGGDAVESDPAVSSLTAQSCTSAAQAMAADTSSSVNVDSVNLVPYVNGTCLFTFQTSDASTFAKAAPGAVAQLVSTMGNANDHPYLIEVDDQTGAPVFVTSWVPGEYGDTWIKPGLSRAFVP